MLRHIAQAQSILRKLDLPNSYTLTKHMAEELLADHHAAGTFRVSIVRPSIVGALAYAPLPGYFGNTAGVTAAALAFATGEWPDRHCSSTTNASSRTQAEALVEVVSTNTALQMEVQVTNGQCREQKRSFAVSDVASPSFLLLGRWLRLMLTDCTCAGMAQYTCHNPHNVYDIIPCDVVGSVIMGAAAALDQVR